MTESPPNTHTELYQRVCALMPSWQLPADTRFDFLEGGYSNRNYKFAYNDSHYVLRLPQIKQPYVEREAEVQWYKSLARSEGVKQTVQPLVLDQASGAMISKWVDGILLVDAWQGPNNDLNIDDLVNYLSKLHNSLPSSTRKYDIRKLSSSYGVDELGQKLQIGSMQVSEYNAPSGSLGFSRQPNSIGYTVCHNDLNPWNIMLTEKGWITFDWEFAGINDPLFDLVTLHQGLELDPNLLHAMAEAYFSLRGFSNGVWSAEDIDNRLMVQQKRFWLREYGWAHFQLAAGNNRTEIADQYQHAREQLAQFTL